jgi:hypothetical protein
MYYELEIIDAIKQELSTKNPTDIMTVEEILSTVEKHKQEILYGLPLSDQTEEIKKLEFEICNF